MMKHDAALARDWPILKAMAQRRHLQAIDLTIAERFAAPADETTATFLCHLSSAVRQGHLCIRVEDDKIIPNPSETWIDPDGMAPSQEDSQRLETLIRQGAAETYPEKFPVHRDGRCYYFRKYWQLETEIIEGIVKLLAPSSFLAPMETQEISTQLIAIQEQGLLLPEQAKAIISACSGRLTVITGGPGTGKTYTVGILLRLLAKSLTPNFRITLAAPTGKAAANLETSIKRLTQSATIIPKAQTLHALLKVGRFGWDRRTEVLDADMIIVDECSMVDAFLMERLLKAIKPSARLILLGDPFQLPSVEAGSLFSDLVSFLSQSHKDRLATLEKCVRAESQDIIEMAACIKKGEVESVLQHCMALPEKTSSRQLQQEVVKRIAPHFSAAHGCNNDPQAMLASFSHFRLLTPLRQGPLGVDALNDAIRKALPSAPVTPIMIVRNDDRLELFNGEIGLLVNESAASQYALFPSRTPGEPIRRIPSIMLPQYELAYCLSIHKSQGSEFDHVILLLPEGSEHFGRAALYTGATRAKKRLDVWGNGDTVRAMMQRDSRRISGMVERLNP